MAFSKIIKGLNYKQIISLLGKFFKHPFFMIATFNATLKTFSISQKEFPNIHGKHNKANAFRHALWNVLISKKCFRFSSKTELILQWTKDITDWHEEFSPNEEIAKRMDLHNNEFGRDFFKNNPSLLTDQIVSELKKHLETAVLVKNLEELIDTSKMVYLEN